MSAMPRSGQPRRGDRQQPVDRDGDHPRRDHGRAQAPVHRSRPAVQREQHAGKHDELRRQVDRAQQPGDGGRVERPLDARLDGDAQRALKTRRSRPRGRGPPPGRRRTPSAHRCRAGTRPGRTPARGAGGGRWMYRTGHGNQQRNQSLDLPLHVQAKFSSVCFNSRRGRLRPSPRCRRAHQAAPAWTRRCELLAERGEDGVTLRDITTAADANVASVSYHFGSLGALCCATAKQAITRLLDEQLARLQALDDDATVEQIAGAIATPIIVALSDPDHPDRALLRIFDRTLSGPPGEMREWLAASLARVDAELMARLAPRPARRRRGRAALPLGLRDRHPARARRRHRPLGRRGPLPGRPRAHAPAGARRRPRRPRSSAS